MSSLVVRSLDRKEGGNKSAESGCINRPPHAEGDQAILT
jgi:hypothetical protein